NVTGVQTYALPICVDGQASDSDIAAVLHVGGEVVPTRGHEFDFGIEASSEVLGHVDIDTGPFVGVGVQIGEWSIVTCGANFYLAAILDALKSGLGLRR